MRGEHFNVTVSGYEGRRQINVRAGRNRVERIVPPAGEAFGFDRTVWDHEVNVYVSPTGRSVRVWIDGAEVPVPRPGQRLGSQA